MAKWNHTKAEGRKGQSDTQTDRAARIAVILCAFGLLLGFSAAATVDTETFDYTLIIAQAPYRAAAGASRTGVFAFSPLPPEGGRICSLSSRGILSVLTSEFASAAHPSLSFDARRLLFAAKRSSNENWNIWEMDLDGKNKRQLTANSGNCLEPKYLATSSITPPDFEDKVRWILFTSDRAGTYEEHGQEPARALYAQNIEPIAGLGTVIRRTTFNLSSDFSPTVLSDGRVLFTSRQPGDNDDPRGRFPLLVTNWDGTGLNLFCSSHEGGFLKTMACEMPDRTLVFLESEGRTRDGSGQLGRVSFKRPLHSREALSTGEGSYLFPNPLPDGRLLVSYAAGKERRGIYLFDFDRRMPGRKLHQDRKWDDQEALAIVEHPEPQGLLSAVVDAETTADLHCINVYESDLPGAASIKKGDVKSVRIVEGVPIPMTQLGSAANPTNGLPDNVRARILGEVAVEADGSFYVRMPGDTPFYVQLLDAEGVALQTQRGWIWARRGTSRQCIGCHENKELAPENRVTDALVKLHRYSLVDPQESRRMAADFRHSVLPVIQAKCQSCHNGNTSGGGLDLSDRPTVHFNKAYESLVAGQAGGSAAPRRYVRPWNAKGSPLLGLLLQGPATSGVGAKHPAVVLTQNERKAMVEWIDLGARWEN
jgi:hypothetical protein